MASTFYQYAERNADSQINWAEVGKTMVDMLNQEVQLREEKKAAIDEASRKFAEELANAPVGQYQQANEFALQYADDAQSLLLMTDRLLKSGQLKPKDYALIRENMARSTNDVFDIAENLQAIAKRKMDGMQDGSLSSVNAPIMASIESLGKIDGIRAFFDPATGVATIADLVAGANGVQQMGTKRFTTGQLRNIFDIDYKKYNLNGQTLETVKTLGNFDELSWYQEATKGGEIDILQTISSISKNPEYTDWLNKQASAATMNSFDAMSILADWSGEEYSTTFDKSQANATTIYIDRNTGIPELTDDQKRKAAEVVKESLTAAVSQQIQANVQRRPFAPTPSSPSAARDAQQQQDLDRAFYNTLSAAFGPTATTATIDAAENLLLQNIQNAQKVKYENNAFTVTFADGSELPLPATGTFEDFITTNSRALGDRNLTQFLTDDDRAKQRSALSGTGAEIKVPLTQEEIDTRMISGIRGDLESKITASVIGQDTNDVVRSLNTILSQYGYSVSRHSRGYITIKGQNNQELTRLSVNDDANENALTAQTIINFAISNLPTSTARRATGGGAMGGF